MKKVVIKEVMKTAESEGLLYLRACLTNVAPYLRSTWSNISMIVVVMSLDRITQAGLAIKLGLRVLALGFFFTAVRRL